MLERLDLTDFAGDFAVALRLPRLALQRLQLVGKLADDVAEPFEICFGGLQPKLGLMSAAVQAGDARLHPPKCGAAPAGRR